MLRHFRRFISYFLSILIGVMILIALVSGALYVYVERALPNIAILNKPHPHFVSLRQIPKPLIQAVLATEDARFYSHAGVDTVGLARAVIAVALSGRKVQGASTITMQVARHFFLTPEKTYLRKIKEILLAIKIENTLSKDKILEIYLNTIYFGYGADGVSAAARVYFRKKLNQLTLPQMAMLAGIPQSPSRINPINNPQAALKRRNHVLKRMLDVGYIDRAVYEKAIHTVM